MTYHFKIHKEKKGFWAECIELEGCVTQADSVKELEKNASEALHLYLEEPEFSSFKINPPQKRTVQPGVFGVTVDPMTAFAVQMRLTRQKKGLTQKETANRLGMKNIYSYQRLESAKKANPNLSTIFRIKRIFPDFKIDDLFPGKNI